MQRRGESRPATSRDRAARAGLIRSGALDLTIPTMDIVYRREFVEPTVMAPAPPMRLRGCHDWN